MKKVTLLSWVVGSCYSEENCLCNDPTWEHSGWKSLFPLWPMRECRRAVVIKGTRALVALGLLLHLPGSTLEDCRVAQLIWKNTIYDLIKKAHPHIWSAITIDEVKLLFKSDQ